MLFCRTGYIENKKKLVKQRLERQRQQIASCERGLDDIEQRLERIREKVETAKKTEAQVVKVVDKLSNGRFSRFITMGNANGCCAVCCREPKVSNSFFLIDMYYLCCHFMGFFFKCLNGNSY